MKKTSENPPHKDLGLAFLNRLFSGALWKKDTDRPEAEEEFTSPHHVLTTRVRQLELYSSDRYIGDLVKIFSATCWISREEGIRFEFGPEEPPEEYCPSRIAQEFVDGFRCTIDGMVQYYDPEKPMLHKERLRRPLHSPYDLVVSMIPNSSCILASCSVETVIYDYSSHTYLYRFNRGNCPAFIDCTEKAILLSYIFVVDLYSWNGREASLLLTLEGEHIISNLTTSGLLAYQKAFKREEEMTEEQKRTVYIYDAHANALHDVVTTEAPLKERIVELALSNDGSILAVSFEHQAHLYHIPTCALFYRSDNLSRYIRFSDDNLCISYLTNFQYTHGYDCDYELVHFNSDRPQNMVDFITQIKLPIHGLSSTMVNQRFCFRRIDGVVHFQQVYDGVITLLKLNKKRKRWEFVS